MRPRITVLTLAVADLERVVACYRHGLGFPTEGIDGTEFEHGAVAFFDLESGLNLALWRRSDLAHDAGLSVSELGRQRALVRGSPGPIRNVLI